MFNNTYSKTIVSNHVNAVNGNISKTYAKSFFKRFHLKSQFAEKILSEKPTMTVGAYSKEEKNVQAVQMIICGDMEVIAELIFQDDYNELFETR